MNFIFILCLISVATFAPAKSAHIGGHVELTGNQRETAEDILKRSLSQLAADGGPLLMLDQVNSGTVQVDAQYALNVDLEAENVKFKTCDVSIWSRPWLKENANYVTYRCRGEDEFSNIVGA